ncbi:alpha-L-rhamnosidase N-terminal domain-domain-containing protein [Clohesyomyces aquaticus]|uniref:Alpha-L-rhamnosidase N-terminal domain-domain-containing protein n=1 Tax=Clohesyomyces aquaticus TaxID=1231657 RepID=A0A1Y1ZKE1_9PLEO|nr:alpha-L-rhamnosidase N-terminal domain-domain-containing protein [Clohesyomyces aquaticus]
MINVTRCGIHAFHEVLGIDTDIIRFFWVFHSEHENARQTAFQVVVALTISALDASDTPGHHMVWDSCKVDGDEQRNIVCHPGGGFKSASFHYWRVTIWDQNGNTTSSALNEFFTTYPRSSQLLPQYSMNQTYMPHSSLIFRTWPIVFASGLGHFNFSCNGKLNSASGHVLDPGWTNYHRTVQFVAYDVSDMLTEGENVIGAHVGTGFYAGDQGSDRFFWPKYEDNTYVRYGNELCFFAEIHLLHEEGSHDCITTGPEWKIRDSATSLANIYSSETKDFRAYPTRWDAPGFIEEDGWRAATPVTGPRGKLKYQSQPPVTLQDIFKPVSRKTIETGVITFNLGQNASTMIKIEFSGPIGSEIIIRFSETVDHYGKVLMLDPLFKQIERGVFCKVTLAGPGVETWEPDFCFTSTRYIQVEGVALNADVNLPVVHSLVGRHVSSTARKLGSIEIDKEDVSALIKMCYWSFIEKFGWLEVTHLLAPSTQYIRDMETLYSKILDDIFDAQEPNGLVPTIVLEIRYMCGPFHDTITWGGSTHVFEKMFEPCVRYMEYLRTKERCGGLIGHGLGDWGHDIAFGSNQANIETAVYYRSFYTSRDDLKTKDRNMVAQAVALHFELVPAQYIGDYRIEAGEISLKLVWNTLSGIDRPEIVLKMARQEEHPSYMRFIRQGETTLNEFWQDACRSMIDIIFDRKATERGEEIQIDVAVPTSTTGYLSITPQ